MTLDFSDDGKVKIDMRKYVTSMIEEFAEFQPLTKTATTPAAMDLFDIGAGEELGREQRELFHRLVAKGLFFVQAFSTGHPFGDYRPGDSSESSYYFGLD